MEKYLYRDYWPTNLWLEREPEELGLDPKSLDSLDREIRTRYKKINGCLIVKGGYIVHERYYNGFNKEDIHVTASVTKSIISALIGKAIELQKIKGTDDEVMNYFPEFKGSYNLIRDAATIEELLTMTAAFPWNIDPLDKLRRQNNWTNYILDSLGKNARNLGRFKYNSGGCHLLSAILTTATGMSARELANMYIFEPIGIQHVDAITIEDYSLKNVFTSNKRGWLTDHQGVSTGGWGLNLNLRDWARFGYLYLNNGYWDGMQIIKQEWVKTSTSNMGNDYGYLWWSISEGDIKGFTAAGSGGNYIICLPSEDLVAVITAEPSKSNQPVIDILIRNLFDKG